MTRRIFAFVSSKNCIQALVFVGSLAWTIGPAMGHEGEEDHAHGPEPVDLTEVYAPTVLPDRIVLTWTGDPATSQAVTWRTSTEVREALAEIAPAGPGPKFPENATTIPASSQALMTNLNTAHFHTVEFKDLKPSTKYAYRVGDGVNWSEWFHFTTASDQPEPFSFIYFGDAQNDVRSMWSRVIREAYGDALEDPRTLLDLTIALAEPSAIGGAGPT